VRYEVQVFRPGCLEVDRFVLGLGLCGQLFYLSKPSAQYLTPPENFEALDISPLLLRSPVFRYFLLLYNISYVK
jgi:hypothetical protein